VSATDVISVPEALVRAHARSERRRSVVSSVAMSLSAVFSSFWFLIFLVAATPIAFLPLVALASSIIGVGSGVSRGVRAHRVLRAMVDGPGVVGAEYAALPGLLILRLEDGRTLSIGTDELAIERARRTAERRGVLPEARLLR
jgi:hypothetical protein